jgi:copper chaperone CopZ
VKIAKRLLGWCVALFCLIGISHAESRTWTQAATGKTITGELQTVSGNVVRILRDGGVAVDVPLAMLGEADQAYVATWQAQKSLPPGPVELTLANAHLCCGSCRDAVIKATAGIAGVTVTTEGSNVKIASPDAVKAADAVKAIQDAGYYGVASIDAFASKETYPAAKTKSATLTGMHLCCGKCVTSASEAIKGVEGVSEVTGLEKNATEIKIAGDFSPAALAEALHAAGFHAGGLR